MDFNNWGNALNSINDSITANIPSDLSTLTSATDTKLLQIETAKRALQLYQSADSETQDVLIQICLATASNDQERLQTILQNPDNWKYLTEKDNSGVSPLIYSICFSSEDDSSIVETILSKSSSLSDSNIINEYDNVIGYTPLMWAVYLGKKDIITELLNHGADLNQANAKGTTVFDLLREHTDVYDYFEEHGLLKEQKTLADMNGGDDQKDNNDAFYRNTSIIGDTTTMEDDELLNNIKLKTAGWNTLDTKGNHGDDGFYQSSTIYNDSMSNENFDGEASSGNIASGSLFQDEFNFNKLLKNQYIIFSDYDIPLIIDLLFKLNDQYNHKVTYPAAILYQCVRYADHVKENDILVENFLSLAFTKLRATLTTTATGVSNVYHNGDIVSQSYWVSVLNFLYYYLLRDDGFFKRYPRVLQDLSVTLNALIIELTNSMKFRLESLIDDCLLNYTNIPEISSTLYKNDWNFFKKKSASAVNQNDKKSGSTSYDEIYQMLYPPSLKDQAKPSPIKIVQTLGALLYVLDLHQVHSMIAQETLSIVFHWLSSVIFNRMISHKKLLTRAKAIQIRLNLSILEDWARSNNRTPNTTASGTALPINFDLLKSHPLNLLPDGSSSLLVQGIMRYKGNESEPMDVAFYRRPLFHIVEWHFEPVWQLLQWLQCFTMITDEDGIISLVHSLTKLNERQLLKTIDKYRYAIDEEKFPKQLYKLLQVRSKQQDQNRRLYYLKNDELVQLNPDYQFPVILPIVQELIEQYGSTAGGLGGLHNKEKALSFQPFLPVAILDSIDEIHDQKTKEIANQTEHSHTNDVDQDDQYEDEENQEKNGQDGQGDPVSGTTSEFQNSNGLEYGSEFKEISKDDGLFQKLTVPESLARRGQWGGGSLGFNDDENTANPWY
ncbi:hypothetical protein WICPIJ_004213 [Wickerhamomyces pijperi]|uniref:Dilute domain-containing protein n=1 Tax=Wickerhamomyces pijperi TaxID=599730 RepID=A0A9P8Q618_WICPI|nr:hypothetical protein WICPIJ_004213 [Wickerhamomyces pijperi]